MESALLIRCWVSSFVCDRNLHFAGVRKMFESVSPDFWFLVSSTLPVFIHTHRNVVFSTLVTLFIWVGEYGWTFGESVCDSDAFLGGLRKLDELVDTSFFLDF